MRVPRFSHLRDLSNFSSTLVRLAGSCLLEATKPALRTAVGPSQYGFTTPNGLEAILFGVRAAREGQGHWLLQLDVANAFNEISRERIWQRLEQDPALAPLRPFYRLLYLDRPGALWYYPSGSSSPHATLHSDEGTRQGCVLGGAFFALGFAPFLDWISGLCETDPQGGDPVRFC